MTSSNHPTDPSQIEALNGLVQVDRGHDGIVGLLIDRGELGRGVVLTPEQARDVAEALLKSSDEALAAKASRQKFIKLTSTACAATR